MQAISKGPFSLEFGKKTYIMGILNVTPDSFSDGGRYTKLDEALRHAEDMVRDGADIIDIGGESTRPGAEEVSEEEEILRVVPIIERLAQKIGVPISVDTYKAHVASESLEAGAWLINDISGFTMDPEMLGLIAEKDCPAVITHIKGTPRNMQKNPVYQDVIKEVMDFLKQQVEKVVEAGARRENMILDPGFGFGKTVEHNLELIRRLDDFKSMGLPILMGTSRKSTIGTLLGGVPPLERVNGTAATVALSIANGADIVRVHDVKQMAEVAKISDAIVRGIYCL